jgi:hypothetical protein
VQRVVTNASEGPRRNTGDRPLANVGLARRRVDGIGAIVHRGRLRATGKYKKRTTSSDVNVSGDATSFMYAKM